DSIRMQTYKNIEIILIDDGSTDNSGKIANENAALDNRLNIIHQANKGLSAARNRGIEEANGEYLTFVDSDDYLAEDYIEYLYNLLKKTNFKAPLAICSLMNVYSDTGKEINCGNNLEKILSGHDCIEKMCYHDLVDTCAYAKLGKRELYDRVKFPVNKLFEDIATTYLLFDQCEIVSCGFKPKYYYVIRDDSIVTAKFHIKKLDLLEMTDQMAKYVTQKYPDLKRAALRRQVYARFSTLNQMLNTNQAPNEKKAIIDFLKKHQKEILEDPRTPKRDRVAFYLLNLGFPVYREFWKLYNFTKKSKLFK
ncbi:glycosyltransferase family 2 protein, partial [Liquorilactobacillus satsumensis]|uniref:glycosyltransferase family 2 protein n=1 Tax=Liquorilactobacillus satsumensis TaxID=259059 RepID=UPI0039EC972A